MVKIPRKSVSWFELSLWAIGRYLFHVISKISGGFWTIIGAVLAVLLGIQTVQATEINIQSTIQIPIEFMANLKIDQMDLIVELLEDLAR